jgi:phage terminase small subunit
VNTDKQEKFIEHYCRTGNATQSAIYAGYSEKGAVQAGHRLKRQFSDQIQERIKRMVQDMVPASLSAIQALIDQGESESVRLAAAKDVLDRAGLKPVEKTEVTNIESMSDEEIQRRIDALTKH